jgi:hypothetical protein
MNKILINAGPSERGWHRLEAVLRCPQLYAWGYGRKAAESEGSRFPPTFPLVRGSIGHVGLAHLYERLRRVQIGEGYSDLYSPSEAMRLVADSFGSIGEEGHGPAARAVKKYAQRYGSEPFTIVGVEEPIETVFLGWRYTARADLIFRDRAGRVWIMDHKFVGKIESKVYRRYLLSGQFLGLAHLGSRLYGTDFGGIRVNLIGCADGKFERFTPEPAPWMLQKFPDVVREAEERIAYVERCLVEGRPIPASPSEHTCMGSYGECPAFEFCRWGASIPSLGSAEIDTD